MWSRSLFILLHLIHSIAFLRESQEAQLGLQWLVLLAGAFQQLLGLLQLTVDQMAAILPYTSSGHMWIRIWVYSRRCWKSAS
jgi:hypothetical protein